MWFFLVDAPFQLFEARDRPVELLPAHPVLLRATRTGAVQLDPPHKALVKVHVVDAVVSIQKDLKVVREAHQPAPAGHGLDQDHDVRGVVREGPP